MIQITSFQIRHCLLKLLKFYTNNYLEFDEDYMKLGKERMTEKYEIVQLENLVKSKF